MTDAERISEALRLLEEAAKNKKDELRTLIADKYVNLKTAVVEGAVRAKDVTAEKTRVAVEAVDENIHKNPWPYVGGAAALGLLLGYILGRKRD